MEGTASQILNVQENLTRNARTKWNLSVAAGPQNFQLASFFQNVRYMIAQMADPQAYEKFVVYASCKKPASMDPSTLVDRGQTLVHYATYLPIDDDTAGPEIPVSQQKRMILNMFPEPWARNFTNSGQNPSTFTIVTLLSYMNEQHSSAEVMYSERKHDFNHYIGQNDNTKHMHGNGNGHTYHFHDYHDGHNNNTNGNNNDYHHHHDQSAYSCGHNFNHYISNYYQRGANSGHRHGIGCAHNGHENAYQLGSFTPIQQDDECRIHGGHLW
jgi:hypothetical protein